MARDHSGSVLNHSLAVNRKTCIKSMILIEILLSLQNRKHVGEDLISEHHPGSQLPQQ